MPTPLSAALIALSSLVSHAHTPLATTTPATPATPATPTTDMGMGTNTDTRDGSSEALAALAFRTVADGWSWPDAEAFRHLWLSQAVDDRTIPLIRARAIAVPLDGQGEDFARRLRAASQEEAWAMARAAGGAELEDVVLAALAEGEGGTRLVPVFAVNGAPWTLHNALQALFPVAPEAIGARVLSAETALLLDIRHRSAPAPVRDDDWSDWVYASTLLAFEGPVYAPEAEIRWNAEPDTADLRDAWAAVEAAQDRPQDLEPALQALLQTDMAANDSRWADAITRATDAGLRETAIDLYARYRPVGRCSMDTWPQSVARSYAQLCYEEGHLGCFLQLQVRIMDANFSRVVWSSYGDAAQDTESDALTQIGIDASSFLMGMMLAYQQDDGREIDMGLYRLGRAISESSLAGDLHAELTAKAQDPALDEYNRLRATITLYNAHAWSAQSADAGVKMLSSLSLSPLSTLWLSTLSTP